MIIMSPIPWPGPVFADGSVMDNCKDVSSSPLFRRDPKKSTAAPRETTATFNTNAQQEHSKFNSSTDGLLI